MSQVTEDKAAWNPTNEQYHRDTDRISHSMLEVFRRSVVEYDARFVLGTMAHPAPTPQMVLGSALHVQILESDKWDGLIAVAPEIDRRTKIGKEKWLDFVTKSHGRLVITLDQYDAVLRMAKSLLAHPIVKEILSEPGVREQALRGTDPETGLPIKLKPDVRSTARMLITDVKTTCDPSPEAWARQAANIGWSRQTAFYTSALRSILGGQWIMVHAVVQNCEPWEAACYHIDSDDIEVAATQNANAMRRLKACYESDDWTQPQHKQLIRVTMPRWVAYQD